MTEEPYRWLEAVANRRDYVKEQIKPGTPVFAACLEHGIVIVGVGSGQSKVFEIHDREAMAGLGHPADIEKIRQAAVDAAHLEAFTRAAEDITLRRLVSFNLGPTMKQQFEQLFSAPFLAEVLLAELRDQPHKDVLVNLHFDGSFQFQHGGIGVAASDSDAAGAARDWLSKQDTETQSLAGAVENILQAWWMINERKMLMDNLPSEGERKKGWRQATAGREVEIGWLDRRGERAARFSLRELASLS